jgi:hypothetical protein
MFKDVKREAPDVNVQVIVHLSLPDKVCIMYLHAPQDVMAEVRRPTAAQRVIKVRNVRIALAACAASGIDLTDLSANRGEASEKVTVKVDDILSGHCREVLALLWSIAVKSFARTVPVSHLETEVRLLERKIASKGLKSDECNFNLQPGNSSPVAKQLLAWVRAVCGLYGVTVRNCGSSFADGSVLCLLIHHYVPSLVPWTSIQIPPPVPLNVAQQMLGSGHVGGLASLSWADYIGMQNSVIQDEIEEYRQASSPILAFSFKAVICCYLAVEDIIHFASAAYAINIDVMRYSCHVPNSVEVMAYAGLESFTTLSLCTRHRAA